MLTDTHTFFWLVGLLEGEAYFGCTRGQATIEVEMKDEHVVARLAALWSLKYSRRDRRRDHPANAVTYRVRLTGKRAVQLMWRLHAYMSPRRQRAIANATALYTEAHSAEVTNTRIPMLLLTAVPYPTGR